MQGDTLTHLELTLDLIQEGNLGLIRAAENLIGEKVLNFQLYFGSDRQLQEQEQINLKIENSRSLK